LRNAYGLEFERVGIDGAAPVSPVGVRWQAPMQPCGYHCQFTPTVLVRFRTVGDRHTLSELRGDFALTPCRQAYYLTPLLTTTG